MKNSEKLKFIFYGLLIGLIIFPVFTFGDSFVSFLAQGKSTQEAMNIVMEQARHSMKIDQLTKRIDELDSLLEKETACRKKNEIFEDAQTLYWQGYHRVILAQSMDQLLDVTREMIEEESDEDKKEFLEKKLGKLEELNEEFLLMKERCGE